MSNFSRSVGEFEMSAAGQADGSIKVRASRLDGKPIQPGDVDASVSRDDTGAMVVTVKPKETPAVALMHAWMRAQPVKCFDWWDVSSGRGE